MHNFLNWDLDSIFTGGSGSVDLSRFIEALERSIAGAEAAALPVGISACEHAHWVDIIERYFDFAARLSQARSFAICLEAQDVGDESARLITEQLKGIDARIETLWTHLNALLAEQPEREWKTLLENRAIEKVAFRLNEGRELARRKMPPEKEALVNDLSGDGYHAWGQLYDVFAGLRRVGFRTDGKTMPKSLGQLQNLFMSHPDRDVRCRAYRAYNEAFEEMAPVIAMALNYQAGFRLSLYRHRKWPSVLEDPLFNNRISRQTLDCMWQVVAEKSAGLRQYFDAKARLLGVDRLFWYDLSAPVGNLKQKMTYAQAGDFIVDSIHRVNPEIAEFCRMAMEERWVEAEDRPGKRAGAFCTGFPIIGQSRIFMTFSGSYAGMSTLAHELGHGYHSWVMRDLPMGARRYTMGVAETASTLNELIVTDASLESGDVDDAMRLGLLNQKLEDAATFFMNIRARYDFERAFYQQRRKGHLSVDALSALMHGAQKTAFQNSLSEDGYHPLFWASKLHFYITRSPFYNFPYTFGYLFSQAVYRRSKAERGDFVKSYKALLRDTGSMDTETLAEKHLGVDLTRPAFWEETADDILEDVGRFVRLASKLSGERAG